MSTPAKLSGSDFAIAAAVNVLLYRTVAVSLKAPGWVGGAAAAIAMSLAVDPNAPANARKIGGAISAPGALAIQLFRSTERGKLNNPCPCPGGGKDAPCRC